MKEILEDTNLTIGKTVSKVSQGWNIQCIHFTDNTCIVFTCKQEYEGSVGVANITSRLNTSDRLELNIISEEEVDKEEEVAKEKTKKQN